MAAAQTRVTAPEMVTGGRILNVFGMEERKEFVIAGVGQKKRGIKDNSKFWGKIWRIQLNTKSLNFIPVAKELYLFCLCRLCFLFSSHLTRETEPLGDSCSPAQLTWLMN